MKKLDKSRNNIIYIWAIIATISLFALSIAYMGDTNNLLFKCMLGISSTLTMFGLIKFETKAHIGMILFGISEIISYLSNYLVATVKNNQITVELVLGIILICSAILICVIKIKKDKQKINLKSILKMEIKPYNTNITMSLIIIAMMVTVVFTMTTSYKETNTQVSPFSMAFVLMPTFIMLLTVIPTTISIYTRIIYYMMWVGLLGMANQVNIASPVSLVEPIIYLISVVIGRWAIIMDKAEKEKEIAKIKKKPNE